VGPLNDELFTRWVRLSSSLVALDSGMHAPRRLSSSVLHIHEPACAALAVLEEPVDDLDEPESPLFPCARPAKGEESKGAVEKKNDARTVSTDVHEVRLVSAARCRASPAAERWSVPRPTSTSGIGSCGTAPTSWSSSTSTRPRHAHARESCYAQTRRPLC
jgi:hypothetical protein